MCALTEVSQVCFSSRRGRNHLATSAAGNPEERQPLTLKLCPAELEECQLPTEMRLVQQGRNFSSPSMRRGVWDRRMNYSPMH